MLDLANSHVWTWDARPWPSFPQDGRWGDAGNWWQGHWLAGRIGNAPGREAIRQILVDGGFSDYAIETMQLAVDGITSGSIGSARSMLEAIRPAFQFDAVESGGAVRFLSRHARAPVATVSPDELVLDESGRRFRQTRGQETDLPHAVKLRFGDPCRDDQPAGTEARRATGASIRTIDLALPVKAPAGRTRALPEGRRIVEAPSRCPPASRIYNDRPPDGPRRPRRDRYRRRRDRLGRHLFLVRPAAAFARLANSLP